MSKLSSTFHRLAPALQATAVTAVAIALSGCVAQVRVAGPPPVYVAPGVDVEVREAPPPLPDYEQPPCPEDGYMWTPGYWAWAPAGYYWVPGTWVQPPRVGVLWTPGYWGFVGGVYAFHAGYWGPHVGFYGGVNYGFGYVGSGFAGGAWVGNSFSYNRAVTNVNVTVVHNTYNTTVINNVTVNKVSYNGGAGGVALQPSAQERQFQHEQHVAPTPMQQQHLQQAQKDPALFAHANNGHPAIAATPRPAAFNAPGVVGARGAPQGGNFARPQSPPSAPAPAGQPQQSYQAHAAPQGQAYGQGNSQGNNQRNNQANNQANGQRPAFNAKQGSNQSQNEKKKNPPKQKPKPRKERDEKDSGGR